MKANHKKLLEQFKTISNKQWIKGINNYTNSAGLTFESLLNKKSDSMYFPDYEGIEIKCTQRFSGYPISLFSLSFDGNTLYEMNRLLTKYGKEDTIYKDKKILFASLSIDKPVLVNDKFYFKLEIDEINEKIYLSILDQNKKLLEKESYIDFNSVKNRLEVKLSNLAMIWVSKRKFDDAPYFRYYKIVIYKLTSFERFIKLIKQGIIKMDLIARVSRSGSDAGRQRNKNLLFKIDKKNIELLFDVIDKYDNDSFNKFQIL